MKLKLSALALATSTILTGCGGGGGSSSDETNPTNTAPEATQNSNTENNVITGDAEKDGVTLTPYVTNPSLDSGESEQDSSNTNGSVSDVVENANTDDSTNNNEAVDVTEPEREMVTYSGYVADGYLSGATVCMDWNLNNVCDPHETSTVTDAQGFYEMQLKSGSATTEKVLVEVTPDVIDLDTGNIVGGQGYTLSAPLMRSEFISPFSSILFEKMNGGMNYTDAMNDLAATLGIPFEEREKALVDYIQRNQYEADFELKEQMHKTATLLATAARERLEEYSKSDFLTSEQRGNLMMKVSDEIYSIDSTAFNYAIEKDLSELRDKAAFDALKNLKPEAFPNLNANTGGSTGGATSDSENSTSDIDNGNTDTSWTDSINGDDFAIGGDDIIGDMADDVTVDAPTDMVTNNTISQNMTFESRCLNRSLGVSFQNYGYYTYTFKANGELDVTEHYYYGSNAQQDCETRASGANKSGKADYAFSTNGTLDSGEAVTLSLSYLPGNEYGMDSSVTNYVSAKLSGGMYLCFGQGEGVYDSALDSQSLPSDVEQGAYSSWQSISLAGKASESNVSAVIDESNLTNCLTKI